MSKRVATQEKSTMVLNEGSVEPRKGEESMQQKGNGKRLSLEKIDEQISQLVIKLSKGYQFLTRTARMINTCR